MSKTRSTLAPPLRLQRHIERFTMAGLLLTALLVGLVTLLPMYHHLRAEIDQRTAFDARLLAQTGDHLFERFESTAALLSSRSEIRDALARYNHGKIDQAELQAFSLPRLQDALMHSPEIAALLRLDARGQVVLGLSKDIPSAFWPLPPATATDPVLGAPHMLDGEAVLLVGSPILSREGVRLGTDIIAFRLERLSRLLTALPLHPATHSHLVHLDSGHVLHIHDGPPYLSEASNRCPMRETMGNAKGAFATISALPVGPQDRQMAFVSPLETHSNWAIGLLADQERLYSAARQDLLWPLLGILLLTAGGGALTGLVIHPLSRRLGEQASSLELAASVFECSNEGIALMDTERRIIAINPAASRLTGHDADSIGGHRLCELLASENPELQCASLWARAAHSGHWLGEVPLRRLDGSSFHAWLSLAAVYDENRIPCHFAAVFADISKNKAEEERIRQMAYYDKLTGLANRALAQDRLQQALRKGHRKDCRLAVLFLDLDRFKPVNDTYGHLVGDHLLQAVAERLLHNVRETDTVARLGGDEFLIIVEDLDQAAAGQIAAKLVDALQMPFLVDGHELHIGTSIGIALYPEDGEDATELVRSADAAMYQAKENGRNRYAFHADMHEPAPV